ncbi:MAG: sulfite exporter TauE/SafE family protein [Negativicutes bacterium]|nr:sulfite exporter TauE/SafE family protein [Negativicutes bacterium]MDR3592823.1 sulfite exporter TauE/SafE family protein [Negativicutes bacterium]
MDIAVVKYLVLVSVTLLASVVTLLTSFGVGTILLPAMTFFFDIKVAVFLVAIVHFFNNLSRVLIYRSAVDWSVIRRFGVISLIGAFLGSYLQMVLYSNWLKAGVGLFLAVYGLWQLAPHSPRLKLPQSLDVAGGFFSGLLGGLIGNQGAIRSLYLLNYKLEKEELIASAALIAVIIDATRIPVYAVSMHSYLEDNALLVAVVVATAILGTKLGGRLLPKVSAEGFKRLVLAAVTVIGVLMLAGVV